MNPYAIGSLLRVFYWAWFNEWLVFVTEVVLILAYYLTWKHWTGARKRAHQRLGVGLAVASWVTMAIIVAILGFMMDPGSWRTDKTLLSGFLNPLYLPQLAFRTPLALGPSDAALVDVESKGLGRWRVHCPPASLAQTLSNLIRNGIDATRDRAGEARVRLRLSARGTRALWEAWASVCIWSRRLRSRLEGASTSNRLAGEARSPA